MVKPKDGAETALEFAVELLEEYGYWSWTPYEEKRHREHVAALIEADRAAVREECLRRAAEAINKLESPGSSTDADIGIDIGLSRAESAVRALLSELSTPSPKGQDR